MAKTFGAEDILAIGGGATSPTFDGYEFGGFVDDVRIYGTALTASQISNQLYRVFKGKYGL